jgi:glycosyltransferase involved in cell wall biosynthesis
LNEASKIKHVEDVDLPVISIITVCYNSAKTIEDTIKSIANQSYPNIEYIIIDGGSTDGTIDVIRSYEKHIAKWVSEPDDGIYDAMNKGIKIATGELIGIVNSDDYLECDAIENVVGAFLENLNGDVFHGKVRIIDEISGIKYIVGFSGDIYKQNNFKMNIPHPGVFIKKSCYLDQGLFNTKYKLSSDHELILRLIHNNREFVFVNKVISNMRAGGVSSVRYIDVYKEKRIINLKYGQNLFLSWTQLIDSTMKTFIVKLLASNSLFADKYAQRKNKRLA